MTIIDSLGLVVTLALAAALAALGVRLARIIARYTHPAGHRVHPGHWSTMETITRMAADLTRPRHRAWSLA